MQSLDRPAIVVLGDINADLTMHVPAYPAEGDDSTAQALFWGSGGTGVNAATTFALLGGQVTLLGRVGVDPVAAVALRAARAAGVDLAAVQEDAQVPTGLCSAMVSASGQRTFFSFRGANVHCDPEAITPALFAHTRLLYLSAYALLEGPQRSAGLRAIELAAAQHLPIALDLGVPPARACRRLIMELLPFVWFLSMNEDELRLLVPGESYETALEMLLAQGVQHVALKRGGQGCIAAAADGCVQMLPPVVSVIDTNGCGDAFAAAYAWALLQQADSRTCATLGNLLGALTATRPGSADALPSRQDILARLAPALHHLLL